jgi:hypothetical protein
MMMRFLTPPVLLLAGAVLGLLSAAQMMENASISKPVGTSKWTEVNAESDDLSGLYRAGHFLKRGQLPPPKGARFFVRSVDDEGNSLRGDCVVTIEGKVPAARWWFLNSSSLTVSTGIDASEVVREANGTFNISVSSNPVSGNWFIPATGGTYDLQFVLLSISDEDFATTALPAVKRLSC